MSQLIPAMPTRFDASTMRAFGALCWWADWIDSGRPALVLNRIPTSGQVPRAPGVLCDHGVATATDIPRRPLVESRQ